MSNLYAAPFRVCLILGVLCVAGIWSGLHLPISLFPPSNKPEVVIGIPYESSTPEEFLRTFGQDFEEQLRRLPSRGFRLVSLEAHYHRQRAEYHLFFGWGENPQRAQSEVSNLVNSFSSRLPEESREGVYVGISNQSGGALVVSFYSDSRSLDSLYDLIEPALMPRLSHLTEVSRPVLYNPNEKELRIALRPEVLATLQLTPRDIENAVRDRLKTNSGGTVTLQREVIQVEMPRQIVKPQDFNQLTIPTISGKVVHLSDVALVDLVPRSGRNEIYKSSGAPSLILWVRTSPGGNVKQMCEDTLEEIRTTVRDLPSDVKFRVMVDPSQFIRSAIANIGLEVILASLLAVVVLFLFIGNFRGVVAAAIEIPLSIILAFILMRIFHINLNLISLGGLALSAGMNVDASVVVMENIFRNFQMSPAKDFATRLSVLNRAVREVIAPLLSSTLISLIVFLPLIFTSGVSYSVLGDLAYAVMFSHGFSTIVALILVPTLRLHLMSQGPTHRTPFQNMESFYGSLLRRFLQRTSLQLGAYAFLALLIVVLIWQVFPRLPKELIGLPDSPWITLSFDTEGNHSTRQLEYEIDEIERKVSELLGTQVRDTFTQIYDPNSGEILIRLSDKKQMRRVWTDLEKAFPNTDAGQIRVAPWNPSELVLPDAPDVKVTVTGPDAARRALLTKEISEYLRGEKLYPRLESYPNIHLDRTMTFRPRMEQWQRLSGQGIRLRPEDLTDLSLIATTGRQIGFFGGNDHRVPIVFRMRQGYVRTPEDIAGIPVGVGTKVVALGSLFELKSERAVASILRVNGIEINRIVGRLDQNSLDNRTSRLEEARKKLATWAKQNMASWGDAYQVRIESGDDERRDAFRQLGGALALSLVLILVILIVQFQSIVEPLLILVAVPLGMIGASLSLFLFGSTLSLNAILGMILLNGIAVANSILLVDFTRRQLNQGLPPREAIYTACEKRLRPILITSLTTILGMLPIAMGSGDGGRVLQPLGIAVAGGLWLSTCFTLFIVPSLHLAWLERKPGDWRLFRFLKARSQTVAILLFVFFSDVAFSGPELLSFDAAVNAIVERHTQVGIEKAQWELATDKNLPSRYSFLPTLSLTASAYPGGLKDSSPPTLSANSSLNLFHFGSDLAAYRAGKWEQDSHASLVKGSILRAEQDAVNALVDLMQTAGELKVYQETTLLIKRLLAVGRERYQRGLFPLQEVEKIEIDLENALAEAKEAEIRQEQARAALEALLGHTEVKTEWPWRNEFQSIGAGKLDRLESEVQKRPDWIAAQSKVYSTKERIDQAWGKLFPRLDLNVGYFSNLGWQRSSASLPEPHWATAITLTVPLFDGLSNVSEYRQQVQANTISELELEQTKRTALKEWRGSRAGLRISVETALSREATLGVARRIYRDNLKRFNRGLMNANDLGNEYRRLLTSELLAVKGWAGAHKSMMQLCVSSGQRLSSCLATLKGG